MYSIKGEGIGRLEQILTNEHSRFRNDGRPHYGVGVVIALNVWYIEV